jgi:hypothetical protein
MPQGTLTPQQLAQAYRAENPSLFDDIDDTTLLKALKDEDPETFALMDPLLEGAEILTKPGARPTFPRPAPLPPKTFPNRPDYGDLAGKPVPDPLGGYLEPPQMPTSLMPTALRLGGSVGGAIVGSAVGTPGVGTAVGGFAGGTAGEAAAQAWEKTFENREAYSPSVMALEGLRRH